MSSKNQKLTPRAGAILIGATLLAFACATDKRMESGAVARQCLEQSGSQTKSIVDVDAFATPAEAERFYEEVVESSTYSQRMQQRALKTLLNDPRWSLPDQRYHLGIAVKQTMETINGLKWRAEYATARINQVRQPGGKL